MKHLDEIKVDKSVMPIHYKDRVPVDLVVGNTYYVSFGKNLARKCTLISINEEQGMITIEIPVKPMSKKGYRDMNGNISHHWVSRHSLFPDEIGCTPEEAVIHEVTL